MEQNPNEELINESDTENISDESDINKEELQENVGERIDNEHGEFYAISAVDNLLSQSSSSNSEANVEPIISVSTEARVEEALEMLLSSGESYFTDSDSSVFDVDSITSVLESDVESIITECSFHGEENWFDARDFSSESNNEFDTENISDENDINEKIKLYNGCQHTVDEAILDLLDDYLNNRETKNSLKDHLSTFIKYLPKSNNLPNTVYHLLKYVRNLAPLYKKTAYYYL